MATLPRLDDELTHLEDEFVRRRRGPKPVDPVFPRGWHECKGCGLGVPSREQFCTLCLFERYLTQPGDGYRCEQCGTPLKGRISRRFCSDRCANRSGYVRRKVAADAAAVAARPADDRGPLRAAS